MKTSVVDLFCGIGGLSHGLINQGLDVVAGIDFDPTCKYAYEKNNKCSFLEKDLLLTPADEIAELFPKGSIKVLAGCAPCQAFSSYSHRYKENDKWRMLYSFSRFITQIKPEIVSMENVPQLMTFNKGKVFGDFIAALEKDGYEVNFEVVNAADYGVPQKRRRLLLLASRLGPIKLLPGMHQDKPRTVGDAIGHLPAIEDGETCPSDALHRSSKLSDLNKRRIRATKPGGSWKDWDEELRLECHKKESGKSFRSVYGRMEWDKPSPTITTQCTGLGNGRFGHPEQDRAISVREAAILQSFPEDFDFVNPEIPISLTSIQRHIGNAVPVLLGEAIGASIKKHLELYGKQTEASTSTTTGVR